MEKIKQLLPIIFLTISTTLMSLVLYFYYPQIEISELKLENNNITVQTKENEKHIIEYSNNPLIFKNNEKISYNENVYVRLKHENETGIHYHKTYKIIPHEHKYEEILNLKEYPTCNKDGINYYKCINCDQLIQEIVPKLNCKKYITGYKTTTCTEDGYTLWRCERCGKTDKIISPKIEHAFIFTKIIKEPTCTIQGEDLYNCIGCNKEKIENTEQISHNYSYLGEIENTSNVGISLKCLSCSKTNNKIFSKQYLGSYQGTLYIPSSSICVPVYCGSPSQPVCDAVNSASLQLFSLGVKTIIADHYYQGGFTNIRYAKPNSTIMYYQGQRYICTENYNGYNNKQALYTNDGFDIRYGSADLYLYTCNDNSGYSIRIVGWRKY
jgi:uncharacterized C2H2 Zn-finger protein